MLAIFATTLPLTGQPACIGYGGTNQIMKLLIARTL